MNTQATLDAIDKGTAVQVGILVVAVTASDSLLCPPNSPEVCEPVHLGQARAGRRLGQIADSNDRVQPQEFCA